MRAASSIAKSLTLAVVLCSMVSSDAQAKGLMERWQNFTGRTKTTIVEKYQNLKGLSIGGNAGWMTTLGIHAVKAGMTGDPLSAAVYGGFAGYNLFRGLSKARTLVGLPPQKRDPSSLSPAANGALAIGLGAAALYSGDPILAGFSVCNAVNCAFKLMNRFPKVK